MGESRLDIYCMAKQESSVENQCRPITGGDTRGAFAPPPHAPKVRILILQVKVCSRLNPQFNYEKYERFDIDDIYHWH